MKKEYAHMLNKSVESISGQYTFLEEGHLDYKNKDVLYLVGAALIDSSCCGSGGCMFAFVLGFVLTWHDKRDKKGLYVSSIETISDKNTQKEIRQVLKDDGMISQVNPVGIFYPVK